MLFFTFPSGLAWISNSFVLFYSLCCFSPNVDLSRVQRLQNNISFPFMYLLLIPVHLLLLLR